MSGAQRLDVLRVPFRTRADVLHAESRVVDHIRAGGAVIHPTETVYGIGSAPTVAGLESVSSVKGRGPEKAMLLLIGDTLMLASLELSLTAAASRLAEAFWPGPLTLVLPPRTRVLPDQLYGPSGGVAVRWTSHESMRFLLDSLGGALTSTSANSPSQPPPSEVDAAIRSLALSLGPGTESGGETGFTEMGGDGCAPAARVRPMTLALDAGVLPPSSASTIVDCTVIEPRIIRVGAISVDRIVAVEPTVQTIS
jgi:L-threonylcarbamoyladenylate synthase